MLEMLEMLKFALMEPLLEEGPTMKVVWRVTMCYPLSLQIQKTLIKWQSMARCRNWEFYE